MGSLELLNRTGPDTHVTGLREMMPPANVPTYARLQADSNVPIQSMEITSANHSRTMISSTQAYTNASSNNMEVVRSTNTRGDMNPYFREQNQALSIQSAPWDDEGIGKVPFSALPTGQPSFVVDWGPTPLDISDPNNKSVELKKGNILTNPINHDTGVPTIIIDELEEKTQHTTKSPSSQSANIKTGKGSNWVGKASKEDLTATVEVYDLMGTRKRFRFFPWLSWKSKPKDPSKPRACATDRSHGRRCSPKSCLGTICGSLCLAIFLLLFVTNLTVINVAVVKDSITTKSALAKLADLKFPNSTRTPGSSLSTTTSRGHTLTTAPSFVASITSTIPLGSSSQEPHAAPSTISNIGSTSRSTLGAGFDSSLGTTTTTNRLSASPTTTSVYTTISNLVIATSTVPSPSSSSSHAGSPGTSTEILISSTPTYSVSSSGSITSSPTQSVSSVSTVITTSAYQNAGTTNTIASSSSSATAILSAATSSTHGSTTESASSTSAPAYVGHGSSTASSASSASGTESASYSSSGTGTSTAYSSTTTVDGQYAVILTASSATASVTNTMLTGISSSTMRISSSDGALSLSATLSTTSSTLATDSTASVTSSEATITSAPLTASSGSSTMGLISTTTSTDATSTTASAPTFSSEGTSSFTHSETTTMALLVSSSTTTYASTSTISSTGVDSSTTHATSSDSTSSFVQSSSTLIQTTESSTITTDASTTSVPDSTSSSTSEPTTSTVALSITEASTSTITPSRTQSTTSEISTTTVASSTSASVTTEPTTTTLAPSTSESTTTIVASSTSASTTSEPTTTTLPSITTESTTTIVASTTTESPTTTAPPTTESTTTSLAPSTTESTTTLAIVQTTTSDTTTTTTTVPDSSTTSLGSLTTAESTTTADLPSSTHDSTTTVVSTTTTETTTTTLVPSTTELTRASATSSTAAPASTPVLRRSFAGNGKNINDPLDPAEIAVRESCSQQMASSLNPTAFLSAVGPSCADCVADVGILTSDVMQVCLLGQFSLDTNEGWSGWMSSLNVCADWQDGLATLTCVDGKVTEMSLASDLPGGYPSYMGKLVYLEYLEVSTLGAPSGLVIDPSLWSLPHLKNVKLQGNWDVAFPAVPSTTIRSIIIGDAAITPSNLQNLAPVPLTTFSLFFTTPPAPPFGSFPTWIGDTSVSVWHASLNSLTLNTVGLTGALPTSLQNLSVLTDLQYWFDRTNSRLEWLL
ncbi:hypothetical protein DFS34DRAFT_43039 [Phlyctochytrium arcticum]|nr:hypothetical protein DFS34DRAFT_43039 [Phlyctochytrium arcticum]